jgi:hypothetical protein
MSNGIDRTKYDPEYRDSQKHHHNQKIQQLALQGIIPVDATVTVAHQRSCGILLDKRLYCDCDPIITVKARGQIQ